MQQGKLERMRIKLDQMRSAVQAAHADVRENILSLRTTLASEKGFIPAVEEYLEEYGIQAHIETQFNNQVEGELNLASLAEVQLVCILQEALTNVRKHARTKSVTVTVAKQGPVDDEYIMLEVKDVGIGFPKAGQKRTFGLQIMRERAQSVGGVLRVSSAPGKGTRVECHIPCLRQEQLQKSSLILK